MKNRNTQAGYTLTEAVMGIVIAAVMALAVTVAIHFLHKFW